MSELLEALDRLGKEISARMDAKLGGLASRDQIDGLGNQVEKIQATVDQINGYVRVHDADLAAQKQWMESHDKAHVIQDKDFRSLSSRVFLLSGGSGLLAAVAMLLQYLKL